MKNWTTKRNIFPLLLLGAFIYMNKGRGVSSFFNSYWLNFSVTYTHTPAGGGGESSAYILRELSACVSGVAYYHMMTQNNLITVHTLSASGEVCSPLPLHCSEVVVHCRQSITGNRKYSAQCAFVLPSVDRTDPLMLRLPLSSVFGQPLFFTGELELEVLLLTHTFKTMCLNLCM